MGEGPKVKCVRCRKVRPHRARGLCGPCYSTVYQNGTLGQYTGVNAQRKINPPLVLDRAGIEAVCRAAVPLWDDLNRTRQKTIRDRITNQLKTYAWDQANPKEKKS